MPTINGKACVANGRNLIIQSDLKHGFLKSGTGGINGDSVVDFHSDNYIPTNGATVFTFSSPDYVFKGAGNHTLAMYDSDKNYLGWQSITSATQTLSKSNVAYIRFYINSADEGNTTGNASDWLANHRYKIEKGSVATPWTPAPVDKVFSNGRQVYGRNLIVRTGEIVNIILGYDGKSTSFDYGSLMRDKIAVTAGEKLTFHQEQPADSSFCFRYNWYDADGTYLSRDSHPKNVIFTVTVPENAADLWISYPNVGRVKVERGTIATDWTPAPEDVM